MTKKQHLLRDVMGLSNFEMIWDDINDIEDHQNKLSDIDEVYHLMIG